MNELLPLLAVLCQGIVMFGVGLYFLRRESPILTAGGKLPELARALHVHVESLRSVSKELDEDAEKIDRLEELMK